MHLLGFIRENLHDINDSYLPGNKFSRFMSWGWSREQILSESVRVLRWESVCDADVKGHIIIVDPSETSDLRKAVREQILREAKASLRDSIAKRS
jgi:hypothetical protein